jgi:hypothetical protein
MRRRWIYLAPLAMAGIAAFIALGGWIVQQLWNWLLPPLFGWHELTFWQALGLLVLCRILFGGLGGPGRASGSRMRRRMEERMVRRWETMTPEERERFRQGMRGRCGFPPPASEPGSGQAGSQAL